MISDKDYLRLRGKVRDTLTASAVLVDLSSLKDELLDAVVKLAVLVIEGDDGVCTYGWHLSTVDDGDFHPDGKCMCCGRPRSEHRTVTVEVCPDEAELFEQRQAGER